MRFDFFDFGKFIDSDSLCDEISLEFLAVLCRIDRITIGISHSPTVAVSSIFGKKTFTINKFCIETILLADLLFFAYFF
jgi:hypothetical protein